MKILVAVDGSDISVRAAKHANALAKRLAKPARIVLVAVDAAPFPGVVSKIGREAMERIHAENHERMLAPVRRALARSKAEVRELAVVGEPADAILAAARDNKVDLLVMGSHGRGSVKGILLGSVSSKVIAQTDIPVTIVR
ncbi:universal stress protein [Luteimonas sp. MC1750]|uniref:universal stress protein n=1 Tax=Luteimonas sp. MC1750 TaxID=2799326 RepID=UPI0018F06F89|nr:universal stress protein [Luteimonas sp. MC1750]MBJ6984140.1 universal stress protein [Luteimonas sp. MC1750]QQO06943.1 universal stress protein [Luteimonas sp. MC1750]